MLDDTIGDVAVETVTPDAATSDNTVETRKDDSAAQASFRQLREKAERAERLAQELARENEYLKQQKAPQVQDEEQEININPDDLVEGKHLSAYNKKLRKLEEKSQKDAKQNADLVAQALIKIEMPDFDSIVNKDTLSSLQSQFPEIAASIGSNTNLHSQAKAAYQAIKKLGINNTFQAEQNIIDKNVSKPKPIASLQPTQSDSPLTQANAFASGLTQDLKERLWKEMQDAANSR